MNNNHIVRHTTRSPYSRLRPIPFTSVQLQDNFWAPRQHLISEISLPTQYQQLEITGRLANFVRVDGNKSDPFLGIYFNESDVYKWLEATAYVLAYTQDENLSYLVRDIIAKIVAIQQPDGYLNAYFIGEKTELPEITTKPPEGFS